MFSSNQALIGAPMRSEDDREPVTCRAFPKSIWYPRFPRLCSWLSQWPFSSLVPGAAHWSLRDDAVLFSLECQRLAFGGHASYSLLHLDNPWMMARGNEAEINYWGMIFLCLWLHRVVSLISSSCTFPIIASSVHILKMKNCNSVRWGHWNRIFSSRTPKTKQRCK